MDTGITVGDNGDSRVDEAAMPLAAMPIAVVMVVTVEKEEVVVAEAAEAVFQRKPSPSSPALDTPPTPPRQLSWRRWYPGATRLRGMLRCRLSRGRTRGRLLPSCSSQQSIRSVPPSVRCSQCLPFLESIAPR